MANRHNENAYKVNILNHLNPENVSFSMFTTAEIKKLCVTKIITPLTLDSLGYPLSGGLYDKKLGSISERGDPCATCNKNIYYCPGHFGYIELPLPVVNPLFHKIVGTILKISCLKCFHLQIPTHIKCSLGLQINLLNHGFVTEAMEIENKVLELIGQFNSYENIPEDRFVELKEYENLIANENNQKCTLNKNIETLRNQFINSLLSGIKPKSICLFCKKPKTSIQLLKNKIILAQKKGKEGNSPAGTALKDKVLASESKYITPEESRTYLREIWTQENELLRNLVSVLDNVQSEHPTDIFFFEVIPVPPPNVRPSNIVMGRITDHPQTRTYKNIIQNTILLRAIIQVVKKQGDTNSLPTSEAKAAYSFARGNSPIEKLNFCWEEIQNDVNVVIDSESTLARDRIGLKQIIEKKSGIIRMHMMGKRVNYSARSVITPDPNLNIDEIGIPEAFAKHLTYPVPVTLWNVEEMRKMIMNGPNVHPGAVMVEFEDGAKIRIGSDPKNQEALLKRLLTPVDKSDKGFRGVKMVYRHLINGDILLLNRQPTLHKPSIMAHAARILKGEKTIRLHYANCKAYNADFDGDEMNAHFPQNEIARSEGYNIVNVSNQYLVPKDGTPLSGLIQDHMIAGVRMSLRGRFFNRHDYQQLVFQALAHKTDEIQLLPPAIMKPEELWSGKQILSTVIINIIPKGKERINLTATSKIPAKAWVREKPRRWKGGGGALKSDLDMSEAEVVIRGGELMVGILDKTHYGATPYGLVHCIYELYGGAYAIRLLSSLAKLFTRFLQQEGFTLGVHDILCIASADEERQRIIKESRKIGLETITNALDLPIETSLDGIVEKIAEGRYSNPKLRQIIDREYKSAIDSFTNAINKVCLPSGLICKFPDNNLQLMVQSGAKGSTVNTMQISCLLGQIELEGKRPPFMISGKSLPSFPRFEFSPRAGGFIDGRFMTGIQPQEFFFHCMAGREGLIDTAVKTSRSGYLQRCLIKHLEGLTVGYDMTVRNSDQSVVQFMYGEDGMDISKAQFLNSKQLQFLYDNKKTIIDKDLLKTLKNADGQHEFKEYSRTLSEWKSKFGNPLTAPRKSAFALFSSVVRQKTGPEKKLSNKKIQKIWHKTENDIKGSFRTQCAPCPDPVNAVFQPDHHYGSLNEHLSGLLDDFSKDMSKKDSKDADSMMKLKTMQSYCAPGEPVGLLAAQSIGEPSTQMTLNTFHFAGRGEMNVTLGIPRLREILMMASKNIKTPSMEVPFKDIDDLERQSDTLRRTLTRVCVADVLEKVHVSVELQLEPLRLHKYVLRFDFLPHKFYKNDYCINPKYIMKHMQNRFFTEMFSAIKKLTKINSNMVTMEEATKSKKSKRNGDDDDDDIDVDDLNNVPAYEDSSDEEVEDEEDAKLTNKFQQAHEDQEPEAEEKEASDDEEDGVPEADANNANDESNSVVESYDFVKNYTFDEKKQLWCELTFALPLHYNKLDMTAVLKAVAAKSIIWEVQNIKKAITYQRNGALYLRTDGININELFKYPQLLNINRLYCNDIHKMADTYGIEAAMKIIVKEVQDVFNVYGIKVDPRHLSLIADYMTFNGTFEPLSRKGMESSASPLQQMSFESSLAFLKAATTRGKMDDLTNPSSCLMVGKPCSVGTGSFTLLSKVPAFAHN